jgi:glutaminase
VSTAAPAAEHMFLTRVLDGIGVVAVGLVPGKGGLGTFAPLLDDAGNSVKGQLAASFLSRRLGLDLLASSPSP